MTTSCQINLYDSAICILRCSCSAPDELNPRELENLLRLNKGMMLDSVSLVSL